MSSVLVIGLSGQIGEALLPRLLARFGEVDALSRYPREPFTGVHWLQGSLEAMPPVSATEYELLISLGPLDAFANWYASAKPTARRVIALGSMGRKDKSDSPDARERNLATRLADAEDTLLGTAARNGAAATVLRPTLVYGNGRDRSLTPLVAFAKRWRFVPIPASASGLRQPVHVDDVATAILDCIQAPDAASRAFDLPGGEVLGFDAMVRRAVERRAPGARIVLVPAFAVRAAATLGALLGRKTLSGSLARLSRDQSADPSPARLAFGYQPGPFRP